MAFNIFTTKRDSCLRQYDRIDDFITCKLCGDKSPVVRQFEVDKFNFSAVFKCLDPRFVLHFRISLTEGSICRKYTPYAAEFMAWEWQWRPNSFHEKAGVSQDGFVFSPCGSFHEKAGVSQDGFVFSPCGSFHEKAGVSQDGFVFSPCGS